MALNGGTIGSFTTRLKLQIEAGQYANDANRTIEINKRLEESAKKAREGFRSLAGAFTELVAAKYAGQALVGFLRPAIELETALGNLQVMSRASAADLASFQKEALRVAAITPYGPVEMTNALLKLRQASGDTAVAMKLLEPTAQLAMASFGTLPLQEASNMMATLQKGFGLTGAEALTAANRVFRASQITGTGLKNYSQIMDRLAISGTQGLQSFDEMVAVFGMLSRTMRSPELAATSLSRIMQIFTDPKAQKTLANLGIQMKMDEYTGQPKALSDIMFQLLERYENSTELVTAAINKAFGSRASRAVFGLLQQLKAGGGAEGFQRLLSGMKEPGGLTGASEIYKATTAGRLQALTESFTVLSTVLGKQLLPGIAEFAKSFTSAVNSISEAIDSSPVLKWILTSGLKVGMWATAAWAITGAIHGITRIFSIANTNIATIFERAAYYSGRLQAMMHPGGIMPPPAGGAATAQLAALAAVQGAGTSAAPAAVAAMAAGGYLTPRGGAIPTNVGTAAPSGPLSPWALMIAANRMQAQMAMVQGGTALPGALTGGVPLSALLAQGAATETTAGALSRGTTLAKNALSGLDGAIRGVTSAAAPGAIALGKLYIAYKGIEVAFGTLSALFSDEVWKNLKEAWGINKKPVPELARRQERAITNAAANVASSMIMWLSGGRRGLKSKLGGVGVGEENAPISYAPAPGTWRYALERGNVLEAWNLAVDKLSGAADAHKEAAELAKRKSHEAYGWFHMAAGELEAAAKAALGPGMYTPKTIHMETFAQLQRALEGGEKKYDAETHVGRGIRNALAGTEKVWRMMDKVREGKILSPDDKQFLDQVAGDMATMAAHTGLGGAGLLGSFRKGVMTPLQEAVSEGALAHYTRVARLTGAVPTRAGLPIPGLDVLQGKYPGEEGVGGGRPAPWLEAMGGWSETKKGAYLGGGMIAGGLGGPISGAALMAASSALSVGRTPQRDLTPVEQFKEGLKPQLQVLNDLSKLFSRLAQGDSLRVSVVNSGGGGDPMGGGSETLNALRNIFG